MSRGHGIGRYYPIKKAVKIVQKLLKPDVATVQGHKMYLDKNDSLNLAMNGIYGEFETSLVKNEISPGDVVIDIGGHIGYFTLIFAKLVGSEGKVFTFEPEPTNFEILRKNVEMNCYQNVVLEQKAVSDKNGTCELFVGQSSSGANRIYQPKKTKTQKFRPSIASTVRLDDYFANSDLTNKIKFIKMDVEGAELLALRGMRNILQSNKTLTIFTEFIKNALEDAGTDPSEMLDFLKKMGFEIYLVDEQNAKVSPLDVVDLLTSKNFEKRTINLLCKKTDIPNIIKQIIK